MSFLDRFRSKSAKIGKEKKPKHVVDGKKESAESAKKKQFAAVPSASAKPAADEKASPAKPAAKVVVKKDDTGNAYRVLLRPVVSEKASAAAANRQYVFMVAAGANKITIKEAVMRLYGVRPLKVNVGNVAGKAMRYGRTEGRTKNWKKAVVTLAPGQTLNLGT